MPIGPWVRTPFERYIATKNLLGTYFQYLALQEMRGGNVALQTSVCLTYICMPIPSITIFPESYIAYWLAHDAYAHRALGSNPLRAGYHHRLSNVKVEDHGPKRKMYFFGLLT